MDTDEVIETRNKYDWSKSKPDRKEAWDRIGTVSGAIRLHYGRHQSSRQSAMSEKEGTFRMMASGRAKQVTTQRYFLRRAK
jgi:hypothetical protein